MQLQIAKEPLYTTHIDWCTLSISSLIHLCSIGDIACDLFFKQDAFFFFFFFASLSDRTLFQCLCVYLPTSCWFYRAQHDKYKRKCSRMNVVGCVHRSRFVAMAGGMAFRISLERIRQERGAVRKRAIFKHSTDGLLLFNERRYWWQRQNSCNTKLLDFKISLLKKS